MIYTSDQTGYVMLKQCMGSDLEIANAAKASFARRSETVEEREKKLIGFLAESDPAHTSPFRHCYVTFEVKAPLFVARQWWKHIIGAEFQEAHKDTGWNEASGRYIAYDGYWTPSYLRIAPLNKKQGSIDKPHPRSAYWLTRWKEHCDQGAALYDEMIADDVAPEHARTILGLNYYTSWWWTASFQAVAHFCNLRDHSEAQREIQEYARIVGVIMEEIYPVGWSYRGSLR